MRIIARSLLIIVSILLFSGCGGERITDIETTIFTNESDIISFSAQNLLKGIAINPRYHWQVIKHSHNSRIILYSNRGDEGYENNSKYFDYIVDSNINSALYIEVKVTFFSGGGVLGDLNVRSLSWIVKASQFEHSPGPDGNVFIRNANDMTALTDITSVPGSLTLENINFDPLTMLSHITDIEGDLIIDTNRNLEHLTVFENLQSVDGDMIISGSLMSLAGLDNLQFIGGDMAILCDRMNEEYGNIGGLESLAGLDNLQSIGGDMTISTNNLLRSLAGLDNLQSVGGDMTISTNDLFNSLAGLDNLQSVGGDMIISQNRVMSFAGLESLQSIDGALKIQVNDHLTSLSELESLQSVGLSVLIDRNRNLCDSEAEALLDQIGEIGEVSGGKQC